MSFSFLHAVVTSVALAGVEPAPPAGDPSVTTDAPLQVVDKGHEKDHGFDALGVPLINYSSDTGVGLGAVGAAYFYGPGKRPYAHAITAQIYFTTIGIQGHYLQYDGPRLLGPFRIEAHVEYHRELYSPFYGPGNNSSPGANFAADEKGLGYKGTYGMLWARTRVHPLGDDNPLQVYAGYQYNTMSVHSYAGSLLAQLQPQGYTGGASPYIVAGILWDTRDDEVDATSGGYAEVGTRVSRPAWGSDFGYQGATANFRRFFPIFTHRIVFALNVAGDELWGGAIPFWEWANFGGIARYEGIGGQGTVRGVARDRYQGNTKLFANLELRFYAITFMAWGAELKIGGNIFFDMGRVWHPGTYDGAFVEPSQWHSGTGVGLRLARRAAIIRLDYADEIATNRRAVYVTFGQMF